MPNKRAPTLVNFSKIFQPPRTLLGPPRLLKFRNFLSSIFHWTPNFKVAPYFTRACYSSCYSFVTFSSFTCIKTLVLLLCYSQNMCVFLFLTIRGIFEKLSDFQPPRLINLLRPPRLLKFLKKIQKIPINRLPLINTD